MLRWIVGLWFSIEVAAEISSRSSAPKVMLATHIRWVNLDGLIYILDLKAEAYFALEPSHSEAWMALAAGGHEDRNVLEHLDKDFCETLRANGWLTNIARPSRPAYCRAIRWVPLALRHSALAAWICLIYVSLSLKLRGFNYLVERLESLPTPTDDDSCDGRAKLAEVSFLRAERFFISSRGSDDCLPRSLALYQFLVLCCGLSARHHIGICRYPFKAHAWVTRHRIALLDKQTRVDKFAELAVLGDGAP
jgi:hypothetical protein